MTSSSLPLLPPKPHFIPLPGELGSVIEMALTPLPFHNVKLHLCVYSVVHSSPIPVSPRLEITQMPINEGMVKSIIEYSPSEILDSSESEPSTTTCNKLDGPQEHDVDRKQLESEARLQPDSVGNCAFGGSKTVGCWQLVGFNLVQNTKQAKGRRLSMVGEGASGLLIFHFWICLLAVWVCSVCENICTYDMCTFLDVCSTSIKSRKRKTG